MRTLIRNVSGGTVTLPTPYDRILEPGEFAVVEDSVDAVVSYLGVLPRTLKYEAVAEGNAVDMVAGAELAPLIASITGFRLMFRPNGADVGPVIFNTWAPLYAQLVKMRAANEVGTFTIEFDDGPDQDMIVIPSDGQTYDMTRTEWVNAATSSFPSVNVGDEIGDDITIIGLTRISNLFIISDQGDSTNPPIVMTDGSGDGLTLKLDDGAILFGTGIVRAPGGVGEMILIAGDFTWIGYGVGPAVFVDDDAELAIRLVGERSILSNNALYSATGGWDEFGVEVYSPSAVWSVDQPGFFGFTDITTLVYNPMVAPPGLTLSPPWALIGTLGIPGSVMQVTGDVDIARYPPPAHAYNKGEIFAVKRTDGGTAPITLLQNAWNDTIDGDFEFTIMGSRAWAVLASDGVSNWNVLSAGPSVFSTSGQPPGADLYGVGDPNDSVVVVVTEAQVGTFYRELGTSRRWYRYGFNTYNWRPIEMDPQDGFLCKHLPDSEYSLSGITSTTGTATALNGGELGHPGVWTLGVSAVATPDRARYFKAGGGSPAQGLVPGAGKIFMFEQLQIPLLPDGVQNFSFRSLGMDELNAADPQNGIWMEVNLGVNGSTNWFLCAANAGTRTRIDLGIPPTPGLWTTIAIIVDAGNNFADALIDGTLFGTISTNLPTIGFAMNDQLVKTLGAVARTVKVDWYHLAVLTSRQ